MTDRDQCEAHLGKGIGNPLRDGGGKRLQADLPVGADQSGFERHQHLGGLAHSLFFIGAEGRHSIALHDADPWLLENSAAR